MTPTAPAGGSWLHDPAQGTLVPIDPAIPASEPGGGGDPAVPAGATSPEAAAEPTAGSESARPKSRS